MKDKFLSTHSFYIGFCLWSGRQVIVKGMVGMKKEPDTLIIGIIMEVLEETTVEMEDLYNNSWKSYIPMYPRNTSSPSGMCITVGRHLPTIDTLEI